MRFDTEKLEWCGYQMVKKNLFEDMFIRFDGMNKRDGHTHTASRNRPRLRSIARQKSRFSTNISLYLQIDTKFQSFIDQL